MSREYRAILEELTEGGGFTQVFFAGYSMGGNLVSKMAGEYGSAAPRALRGVCAICPALDLAACADALDKPGNHFHQRHFASRLDDSLRAQGCDVLKDLFARWLWEDSLGARR
jgi:hypothetical protein